MVTRNYEAPQFNVRDTREVRGGRVDGADTRPNYDREFGDNQWRDRLLSGLGNAAANNLNKLADLEFGNLYLEGQAAVGVAQSEDELEGNPLTRDWKVAGYRDTMGKLALADTQATFMQDLVTLREQGPEQFQSYLNARRQKLTPALASMSREARASAFGQLLLQDRDATSRWKSEHTKFIIDQKSQAVHTQWNTALRGMADSQIQAANGDLEAKDFTETLRSTAGLITGSVWMDPTLPPDVKKQLTFEMAQAALANDSVALYDYLSNTPIADGTGKESTLISRLNGEQQLKLANGYREAYSRTSDSRNILRMEQLANLEAQIDADAYQGTFQELTDIIRPMVLNKTITGERGQAIERKFLEKAYKRESESQDGSALIRGDVQYLFGQGKDISDGVKGLRGLMARRNMSSDQQLQTWLNVGRNGVQEGYKIAGEYLGVTLRQMVDSKDGTVLPQHAAVFRGINAALRDAEAAGLTNTRVNLLSGLGEADRMFAEQIFKRVDAGASLDEAVQEAKKVQADDAALTPSVKAARSSTQATAITKSIAEIEPRGLLETAWDWTKAVFGSSEAAFNLKSTPYSGVNARDNYFRDSPTVQYYTDQVRQAVTQEANDVLLLRPSSDADSVITVAKANVAARTISTSQGPLIMPKNVNLLTTFGVGPGNQASIGKAIDGLLKSKAEDSRWQLSFTQGRLWAQEFDKDGVRVGTGSFINADQIKARIAEDLGSEVTKANERYGTGKVVEADGKRVRYNGSNNAGVLNDWMLGFRDNLVQSEGIRGKVYKDTVGRDTVGIGVASHNPNYPKPDKDGNVTQEQINASFLGASDDAAKAGIKIARRVQVDNKPGFMLMSELAYQSGTAFLFRKDSVGDEYRAFARAMSAKDVKLAQEKFQATAAWRFSGESRRKHYSALIAQALPASVPPAIPGEAIDVAGQAIQ